MATLKDIAEIANVSIGTVDRALKNRPGVNPETKARIESIARSLHYKPNRSGQALVRRGAAKLLGVILEPMENLFFQQIRTGVEAARDRLAEEGFAVEIYCMNTHTDAEMVALLEHLRERKAAGIVINGFSTPMVNETLRAMRAEGIRIVTCNTDLDREYRDCFVGFDHERSGRVAAELLGKLCGGRGTYLALYGYDYIYAHTNRLRGFRAKLAEAFPQVKLTVAAVEESSEKALKVTCAALDANPDLCAIFVTCYGLSGVIDAVRIKRPQGGVHILCYDRSPLIEQYMREGLIDATIVQKPIGQGELALELLSELVTGSVDLPVQDRIFGVDLRLLENYTK